MITLKKLNVVKIVETEHAANFWEDKGFKRVEGEDVQPATETFDPDKPLDEMTLPELKGYAKLKSIDLNGATRKDDILLEIQKAESGE
ncbi:hypothetical protein QYF50_15505 [Paenibacillus vini]|uniref:hypothetical protein n=1 Tax=Paenibacillus vini TaxID=1476024 RepID=UPI0025B70404|nr:hypothetical protein [Paenibacillus vini]MDN4069258.1 hypothetical protein [Paenibacillus vini]MDN4069311.1 hypothetical protein [Paenibacillus vini]